MKKILFVDDERQVLDGLRRRLHRQRAKWDMHFAGSGAEALALLAGDSFDVIVSDMRMPEMDGATLLREVHQRHPRVVRIVLSGYAEAEMAMRVVPVAHQFLNKPCDADVIENVVDRAGALQNLLEDETLRRAVGGIDSLPSLPMVYSTLVAAMSDEATSTVQIAEILQQDVALCAKMLQLVNSAFFGLGRKVARIEEAVMYLGFSTIKNVVLATEVFQQVDPGSPNVAPIQALQAHSMLAGGVARAIIGNREAKEDAYMAGLLHDIGRLILMTKFPKEIGALELEAKAGGVPRHVVERQRFGVTHAEVGGYLLGLWGLPYPIIEAVANHHEPLRVESNETGVLAAVHAADALANAEAKGIPAAQAEELPLLDLDYLKRIGTVEAVPRWREIAHELRAATTMIGV